MHYLTTQMEGGIIGFASPISEKDIAQLAVKIAGGGFNERQVIESMIIAQQMRDGDWTVERGCVSHSIIKAGEES